MLLPEPHWDALSTKLRQKIIKYIGQYGWISFDEYMQLALYDKHFGYYRNGLPIFGQTGDFVTAPQLGPLFAYSLARQCDQVLGTLKLGSILEFGAGNGRLAADVLKWLLARNRLPKHYLIIETSPTLKRRQRAQIEQHCARALSVVKWLDHLPCAPFDGVIIANEVLDAMPVQCFIVDQDKTPRTLGVSTKHSKLTWFVSSELFPLSKRLMRYNLPPGYHSEVGMQAEAWIKSVANVLGRGLILLIDYGFPRHEMYHLDRYAGTLMCHYRHHAHDDPFHYPGLQDISAHIDFTAIAEAALDAGVELAGYTTQGSFLLSLQLLDAMDDIATPKQQHVRVQQIKKLTLPHEMGELFKVICFSRNIELELIGFGNHDRRHKLWT